MSDQNAAWSSTAVDTRDKLLQLYVVEGKYTVVHKVHLHVKHAILGGLPRKFLEFTKDICSKFPFTSTNLKTYS